MRTPKHLGFHGLVVRSGNPARAAASWSQATGLPIVRRSRDRVLIGSGPEVFVLIRRSRRGEPDRIEEVHLAVQDIAAFGADVVADGLGGDGFLEDLGFVRLAVREFRRPPAAGWRTRGKRSRRR